MTPDATQYRRYYYSQPTPEGSQDNNTLEAFFSSIESNWPLAVAKLHAREDVNDRLENIFEFMALQRARVPAARDMVEASLAQLVKDTMKGLLASGKLPPLPQGLEDLPDKVQVSIDPHRSIHAMVAVMQSMAPLFSIIGLAAVHNMTARPFLTSDNPVIWFDPSVPFVEQKPYTINPDKGPVFLFFPVSPKLALVGSTEYKDLFGQHGLQHDEVPNESWVEVMNAQVCRFAYEAVTAKSVGDEEVIARYANISPVHTAVAMPMGKGVTTIHQQVFGLRVRKPKWRAG